ncbi:MAG: 7-cyano-7-deazaguanine synthase QueC [Candidatus Omnitrophica bacterium]|nr:7-cyano-7-deazaguanine synthase QueC [Candidatus Omnitrophota bacterium]MDE2008734.1 7-cyano-7-deazaguanine synthase QueC [Candidatus Omnitrophota bacterium]MDE2215158.1 7-cyano-7-deazaguanine synthase QueC [Candidatus Omnitrophota bacterium]MDE2232161.1 7-cyano-7-deazaguanine synthase QueC [Candidatus Omnitrophota bacterium]
MSKTAVILLSGGLDSSTTLYHALAQGYDCRCLVFDYGQKHKKEISAAKALARQAGCPSVCVAIRLPWKASALLDKNIPVPQNRVLTGKDIPVTYVPGRNIIFLSFAASFAEAISAGAIFIGANAVDYSGYPDCRPEFIRAYQAMLGRGLKAFVQGKIIKVKTPLIHLSKAQIVKLAVKLKVPLHLTWSCYNGGKRPCGVCDSCRLRAQGFAEAKVKDLA